MASLPVLKELSVSVFCSSECGFNIGEIDTHMCSDV
jgi:hypothetical protein